MLLLCSVGEWRSGERLESEFWSCETRYFVLRSGYFLLHSYLPPPTTFFLYHLIRITSTLMPHLSCSVSSFCSCYFHLPFLQLFLVILLSSTSIYLPLVSSLPLSFISHARPNPLSSPHMLHPFASIVSSAQPLLSDYFPLKARASLTSITRSSTFLLLLF